MSETPVFRSAFLAPRYWQQWLIFGLLWLMAQVPYRIAMPMARALGRMIMHLAVGRRRIAEINLELCFPGQNPDTRSELLRAHFESLGMGVYETAICWFGGNRQVPRLPLQIFGREHLERAIAQGKGVLLVAGHFTDLEIGGTLLIGEYEISAVYRPHDDPVFDGLMARVRNQYGRAISRDDTRGIIRALRRGLPIWYAPDQNYKGTHTVFAPFFGVAAATNAATARLAGISKAPVVPFSQSRMPGDRGYRLHFDPPLQDFPGGEPAQDAARVNQVIECLIRRRPADYLWVHRRFKTRPSGEPSLY
jgi:KDO2-lipid IV(A) lauroyltransferase